MTLTAPPLTPTAAPDRLRSQTARLLASDLDKLNFGCGPHPLPGWANIDNGDGVWYAAPEAGGESPVIALDLFEALDVLPDACASCVYSEHVFEHFTLQQGHELLRGWFRVLRPGGVVRVVCPDLESEARLYLRQLTPAPDGVIDAHRRRWLADRCPLQPGETLTRGIVFNHAMWLDGHRLIYDFETLSQSLRLAGFGSVERCGFGRSRHAALCGIDRHDGGETGRGWVPSMALVVEATRPVGSSSSGPGMRRPPRSAAPPTALERATAEVSTLRAQLAALKARLIESIADRCAAAGHRRIALYGAGRHTAPIVREPWHSRGVRVVAILDDRPEGGSLSGVPITRPDQLAEPIDAIVVSSDAHEQAIYRSAVRQLASKSIPILRIYESLS